MKPEKEKWVTDVLNSADGITALAADEQLLTGIRNRVQGTTIIVRSIPAKTVWLAAAGIALLVAFNFVLLTQQANRGNTQAAQQSPYSLNNSFEIY
ncbi:MAG: hypothetical protein U0V74_02845 [Chitinophagales bacterium]